MSGANGDDEIEEVEVHNFDDADLGLTSKAKGEPARVKDEEAQRETKKPASGVRRKHPLPSPLVKSRSLPSGIGDGLRKSGKESESESDRNHAAATKAPPPSDLANIERKVTQDVAEKCV